MKLKRAFFIIFILIQTSFLLAGSLFEQGQQAYLENRPEDARVLLSAALRQDSNNEKAYLFLGTVYLQLDQYSLAAETFKSGAALDGADSIKMLFNAGNSLYLAQDYTEAIDLYSLVGAFGGELGAKAVLNLANVLLLQEQYESALGRYTEYLNLSPDSSQKSNVEQMVEALQLYLANQEQMRIEEERLAVEEALRQEAEAAAAEQARLEAEEAARLAEAAAEKARIEAAEAAELARQQAEAEAEQLRIEEAERQRVEAERQQQILSDIMSSLGMASQETQSISAGVENLQESDEESDIDD